MPYFGLGVYKMKEGDEVVDSVKAALETGYRSIDTAAFYRNEKSVGLAIKESGVSREEIFVTTKLWNSDQGYENTLAAFENSLEELSMDYVDLYLIHWPVKNKYIESWRAMGELYRAGKIKAIGVSNFLQHQMENLLANCEIKPTVNQIEYHPYLSQPDLVRFCLNNNIHVEAWSPLMQGHITEVQLLNDIGEKYGKNAVQVVLRWDLQNEVMTLPKSSHPERIKSNAEIFDFELSTEDMNAINALNQGFRFGPDPDNFDF